jgi:trigger factor
MSELEVSVKDDGPVRRRLEIVVPAPRVQTERERAYKQLAGRAQIAGFRKGKVPRSVLEKEYGPQVEHDVVRHLVEETCADVLREREIRAVASPDVVEHGKTEDGGLRYVAVVEVRPTFELGEYRGLDVVRKIERVEDRHVDEMVERLRDRSAVLETVEERVSVETGDVVEMDMVATSEGKRIDKASGTGIRLEVGSGRFPGTFEEQIVGVTRAIETPIDVAFPDEHGDPELAGKSVRFAVTVRSIQRKVLPTVDDDFVKDLGWEGCESVVQLREKIRTDLEAHAARDADRRMRGEILGRLVEAHAFEVPETLVNRQMGATLRDMGVTEIPEDQVEEIRAKLEPSATKQVRARFLLEAIANAESLEVTKEELENEVRRQLAAAGPNADELRQYYSAAGAVGGLHLDMLREKALERLAALSTHRDEFVEESRVAVSD